MQAAAAALMMRSPTNDGSKGIIMVVDRPTISLSVIAYFSFISSPFLAVK